MLKHEGRFAVGQKIRGYDFKHSRTCYIEGVVLDAKYMLRGVQVYKVAITKQMFDGEDVPNDIGFIPHEVWLFEYPERIEAVA